MYMREKYPRLWCHFQVFFYLLIIYFYIIIFRGYCKDCVIKLKDEYKAALDDYRPFSEEYNNYFYRNINIDSK